MGHEELMTNSMQLSSIAVMIFFLVYWKGIADWERPLMVGRSSASFKAVGNLTAEKT